MVCRGNSCVSDGTNYYVHCVSGNKLYNFFSLTAQFSGRNSVIEECWTRFQFPYKKCPTLRLDKTFDLSNCTGSYSAVISELIVTAYKQWKPYWMTRTVGVRRWTGDKTTHAKKCLLFLVYLSILTASRVVYRDHLLQQPRKNLFSVMQSFKTLHRGRGRKDLNHKIDTSI